MHVEGFGWSIAQLVVDGNSSVLYSVVTFIWRTGIIVLDIA